MSVPGHVDIACATQTIMHSNVLETIQKEMSGGASAEKGNPQDYSSARGAFSTQIDPCRTKPQPSR